MIKNPLLDIVDSVLFNLQPERLFRPEFFAEDFSQYRRIVIFGIGKAAQSMTEAVLKFLPREPDQILLADEGHPLPTAAGVQKTAEIISVARELGEDDLAIVLLSGGGSAMFVQPVDGVTLDDKIAVTRALLRCGADIYEINIVRKHLSQVKGGKFAEILYPAKVKSFVISDVIGNDLGTIASGPLVFDASTDEDALGVIQKYGIEANGSVVNYLKADGRSTLDAEIFRNVEIKIIADHQLAANVAAQKARELGFRTFIISTSMAGESRVAARKFLQDCERRDADLYIASGETTVTCTGDGFGGRNQEFALSALRYLKDDQILAAIGTDGVDGICPEPVAGVIVSREALLEARQRNLDPEKFLANNDSYGFFNAVGGHIKTGPTGTNVGDLILLFTHVSE